METRVITDTTGDQAHAQALLAASRAISSSLDLDETLRLIVREAAAISEAPAVRLFLLDDSGRTLQYRVGTGIPSEEEEGVTIPVGESFSGQVVVTGQPLMVPDTRLESRFIHPMHATKYRLVSYLGLPVKKGNRPFGVLVFNTTAPRIYTESEVSYLNAFAEQAAIAIENARLHSISLRRAQQLAILTEVTHALTTATGDPLATAEAILDAIQSLFPGTASQLWERRQDSNGLFFMAMRGVREVTEGFRRYLAPGEDLAGEAAATGQLVSSPDVTSDPRCADQAWARAEGLVGGLALPLIYGDELLGSLVLFIRAGRQIGVEEEVLLRTFAAQAAIAIGKARLYTKVATHAQELIEKVEERTRELQSAQMQVVQSAKLASVGTLAAGVAHELNQPLMVIRGYVQELLVDERITDPEIQEDLRRIEAQTGRMDAIIKHLRGFSRESTLRRQYTDLNQVVRDAFTFLAQQLKLRGIEVVRELAPTLPSVWGDPLQLEQVVLNLVTNARDAMEGSPDRILTIRTEQRGAETVSLQVADTGCGIQSALQERIFDPFFTTKEIGKGTGLGLSICHGIIQAHGGKIEVESPVAGGRGTRFSVLLPCRATDRGEGSARPGVEMPPPGGDGKEGG